MARSNLTQLHKSCGMTVVEMLTGGFEFLIERAGGQFKGISIRPHIGYSLIIIRANFEGRHMVAFCSADTAAQSITKAHKELHNGGLQWRTDKYRT